MRMAIAAPAPGAVIPKTGISPWEPPPCRSPSTSPAPPIVPSRVKESPTRQATVGAGPAAGFGRAQGAVDVAVELDQQLLAAERLQVGLLQAHGATVIERQLQGDHLLEGEHRVGLRIQLDRQPSGERLDARIDVVGV